MRTIMLLTLVLSLAAWTAAPAAAPATRPTDKPQQVIVQIELMTSVAAATQPVEIPTGALPTDATLVSSTRTLAAERTPFLCDVTNPNGLRTTLRGKGRQSASGHWLLDFSYAFRSADGVYSGSTNMMLKPDERMLIGGTRGGTESRMLILTLLAPQAADAAAGPVPTRAP